MVELVPYDEEWPSRFAASAAELSSVLPDAIVEHVGSTSVPGLSSKDTVDIAVGAERVADVLAPSVLAELEVLGFVHAPGSFADDPDHVFFHRIIEDHRTDHLHVVPRNSAVLDEYLLLRDYLRAVPDAMARYEAVKLALAQQYARDRSEYVDRKQAVVQRLIVAARQWRAGASSPGTSTTWQAQTLAALRKALPDADVEPYGSVLDPSSVDSWSDLDVTLRALAPVDLERLLGASIWAYQSTHDAGEHVVRAVLEDGRRIDLTVVGAEAVLPPAPVDDDVRFDAALAAVHFGRGRDLIGLHLILGILREALVQRMVAADHLEGTTHHRRATVQDGRASAGLALLDSDLGPWTAQAAYAHYCRTRTEVQPEFAPAPDGLGAVIARGSRATTPVEPERRRPR